MKGERMEIGISLLIGLVVGVASTIIGTKINPPQKSEEVATAQQEVIKQLTDLDIVEKLCAPKNVTKIEDRLLCRELTCLVYSRGIDSKTGESCEEIQNLANTVSLIDYCKENMENNSDCYDIFWRRK